MKLYHRIHIYIYTYRVIKVIRVQRSYHGIYIYSVIRVIRVIRDVIRCCARLLGILGLSRVIYGSDDVYLPGASSGSYGQTLILSFPPILVVTRESVSLFIE